MEQEMSMGISSWLNVVILGGLMGVVGQAARSAVGLKKVYDESSASGETFKERFSGAALFASLLIGFVAGVLALIAVIDVDVPAIGRETLLGVFAAGYAGTDFIEGFLKRYLPGDGAKAGAGTDKFPEPDAPVPAVG